MSVSMIEAGAPGHGRIVVGVGARRGVSMAHLRTALADCLEASGGRTRDIAAIVTIEGKQTEPALIELSVLLSVPLGSLPAEQLALQQVPNPSSVAERVVGTPSVAEAAVIAMGAQLLAPKHVGKGVTVALGLLPAPPELQGRPEPPTRSMALQPAPSESHVDLDHHGDAETAPGLVNLAVNAPPGGPPAWLAQRLQRALTQIADHPDQTRAVAAIAARHHRLADQVLLTAGAAEAFVLLARALNPRHAVVIHPQFTEPEAALVAAGHDVHRIVLEPPFLLASLEIPSEADLVIVGNPTNPTSVLHPAEDLLALATPGRVLVVDESFMETVPGQEQSLAGGQGSAPSQVPGLVIVRSLTATWGLAGLRIGYLLGDPDVLSELAGSQPLWPVGTIALEAAHACSEPTAVREAATRARRMVADRDHLLQGLAELPDVQVVPGPQASFVLFQVTGGRATDVHGRLRMAGWAVRRADTFPGLGPGWLRVAVRDQATTDVFLRGLAIILRAPGHVPAPQAGVTDQGA